MTPGTSWIGKRPAHGRRHNARMMELRARLPDRQVREAVLTTLPSHPHSAERKISNFARKMWAVDPSAPASHWRDVVATYHALAGGRSGLTLAQTLAEFARLHAKAGTRVRLSLDAAMEGVRDVGEVVTRMCRLLGRVWFLSVRTLGDWLGVSHETARKRLAAYVGTGSLRLLARGASSPTDREASTYSAAPRFALSDRFEGAETPSAPLPSLAFLPPTDTTATADEPKTAGGGLPCVKPLHLQGESDPKHHSSGRAATTELKW